jgi:TldD protein
VDNVQFQRMPNVSLLPGEKDLSQDDLVAATDRGILIVGDGSFSIDQQRYNAQFGGQVFYEIKGGKVVGQLKDVAYQIRTPDFWNSLDMIGGKRSYQLGGSFFDGKGQPGQVNAVSHGSPPARFRNVNVINTGGRADADAHRDEDRGAQPPRPPRRPARARAAASRCTRRPRARS